MTAGQIEDGLEDGLQGKILARLNKKKSGIQLQTPPKEDALADPGANKLDHAATPKLQEEEMEQHQTSSVPPNQNLEAMGKSLDIQEPMKNLNQFQQNQEEPEDSDLRNSNTDYNNLMQRISYEQLSESPEQYALAAETGSTKNQEFSSINPQLRSVQMQSAPVPVSSRKQSASSESASLVASQKSRRSRKSRNVAFADHDSTGNLSNLNRISLPRIPEPRV